MIKLVQLIEKLLGPKVLKIAINFWPPFLGAGIKVEESSADSRYIRVSMKLRWYNKNYVNVHYGGSLYSMCDPFYMLMFMKNLGPDYIVWDKSASIDFKRPGRGKVSAEFRLEESDIRAVVEGVEKEGRIFFPKKIRVLDEAGEEVAIVEKIIYARKKAR